MPSININFINNQLNQIKEGGGNVIFRKIKTFGLIVLRNSIAIPLIPIILIIRLISPFVLIRFKQIRTDRIGHLAYEPDLYLLERKVGLHGKRTFDFFFTYGQICNKQLKLMWSRILTDYSLFGLFLHRANRFLPGASKHTVPLCGMLHEDKLGLQDRFGPQLFFTPEEERRGQQGLKLLGINPEAKFICFHSRDSAYLSEKIGNNFTYHNYRDSSIQNYVRAIERLNQKDYYSFRMGAIAKEVLKSTDAKIIDYASKYRNEFMDIYLIANCHFYLGTNSGPSAIATIFRKPVAYANVAPFLGLTGFTDKDIFIPKKYWLINEKRLLTFDEIFSRGAESYDKAYMFVKAGIKLIENTPEEILGLAKEMDDRLNGDWKEEKKDKILQHKYSAIIEKNGLGLKRKALIATSFLVENQGLLN